MPHELPNKLRLGILGNLKEISSLGVGMPSSQSPFRKLKFGNIKKKKKKKKKHAKVDIKIFLVLSNFTGFLYFVHNILSGICL